MLNHLDIHDLLEAGTITHVLMSFVIQNVSSHISHHKIFLICPRSGSLKVNQSLCQNDFVGRHWTKTFDRFQAVDGGLVAAQARYHWKCSFFHKHSENNDNHSHSEADTASLKTFDILEQNSTKIWNKMELIEFYEQNGGTTLSWRTLLEKVEGQFGDDIVFTLKGLQRLSFSKTMLPTR